MKARMQKKAVAERLDDVRGRVLAAAVRLIDEGGLDGLSMREVARAAGVSHQAPYHYFEDREAILAAVAESGFDTLAARLRSAREGMASSAERLTALARVYVEFGLEHPAMFRVMFRRDVVDTDRFPECRVRGDKAFAIVGEMVAEIIAEGLPAEPSPQSLVILFWSFAHGLTDLLLDGPLLKKLPDVAKDRDQVIEDTIRAMQYMVEARMPKPKKKR